MKKIFITILVTFTAAFVYGIQQPEIRKVDGKDYTVYKVQKGDTWYSIARQFQVSYAEIRVANKNTTDKLITGAELLIPQKLKANDPYFQKNVLDKREVKGSGKIHEVQPSQTLYSISRMYGVTVDQIKEWNNLKSNEISVGQKLIVSQDSKNASGETKTIQVGSTVPVDISGHPVRDMNSDDGKQADTEQEIPSVSESNPADRDTVIHNTVGNNDTAESDTSKITSDVEKMVAPAEVKVQPKKEAVISNEKNTDEVVFSNGRQQVNETGLAAWIDEEGNSQDKYFALHRTAKTGTVIRVLNLSNSRKVYVKVTGTLSDEQGNDGILIRLSKASAEKLGITDKTARVNLLYGTGEE